MVAASSRPGDVPDRLQAAALSFVAKAGTTQFRVRTDPFSNNDNIEQSVYFYGGGQSLVAKRPSLKLSVCSVDACTAGVKTVCGCNVPYVAVSLALLWSLLAAGASPALRAVYPVCLVVEQGA